MKGVNTLKLNQETMCEALNAWLRKTLAVAHSAKVTQVLADPEDPENFEIIITAQERT